MAPDLGQSHKYKCGGVKQVTGISTIPHNEKDIISAIRFTLVTTIFTQEQTDIWAFADLNTPCMFKKQTSWTDILNILSNFSSFTFPPFIFQKYFYDLREVIYHREIDLCFIYMIISVFSMQFSLLQCPCLSIYFLFSICIVCVLSIVVTCMLHCITDQVYSFR